MKPVRVLLPMLEPADLYGRSAEDIQYWQIFMAGTGRAYQVPGDWITKRGMEATVAWLRKNTTYSGVKDLGPYYTCMGCTDSDDEAQKARAVHMDWYDRYPRCTHAQEIKEGPRVVDRVFLGYLCPECHDEQRRTNAGAKMARITATVAG